MDSFGFVPDEIIVHILGFLPLSDRKSTRLVSNRWKILNNDVSLIQDYVLVVTHYLGIDDHISENLLAFNVRLHLPCEEDWKTFQFDDWEVKFWRHYGKDIQSVKLQCHDVGFKKVLLDITENCPNLKKLSCNGSFEGDLPTLCLRNLSSLTCSANNEDDSFFQSLNDNYVKMSTLKLIGPTFCAFKCSNWISTPIMSEFLKRQGTNLKELTLSQSPVDHSMLSPESLGPQMNSLNFHTLFLNDFFLLNISEKVKSLKMLSIRNTPIFRVTEYGLIYLLSNLRMLTHVHLNGSMSVTDTTVAGLGSLPNLTFLHLSECENITDDGLEKLFAPEVRPKMQHLTLFALLNVTDCSILSILPYLPNLRFLSVIACIVTQATLESILNHNPQLESLIIDDCCLTENFAVDISNTLKELVYLEVGATHDSFDNPLAINRSLFSKMQSLTLKNLRTLKRCCSDLIIVEPLTLAPLFSNCPLLQYVVCDSSAEQIAYDRSYQWPGVKAVSRNLEIVTLYRWTDSVWDEIPVFTRR